MLVPDSFAALISYDVEGLRKFRQYSHVLLVDGYLILMTY